MTGLGDARGRPRVQRGARSGADADPGERSGGKGLHRKQAGPVRQTVEVVVCGAAGMALVGGLLVLLHAGGLPPAVAAESPPALTHAPTGTPSAVHISPIAVLGGADGGGGGVGGGAGAGGAENPGAGAAAQVSTAVPVAPSSSPAAAPVPSSSPSSSASPGPAVSPTHSHSPSPSPSASPSAAGLIGGAVSGVVGGLTGAVGGLVGGLSGGSH